MLTFLIFGKKKKMVSRRKFITGISSMAGTLAVGSILKPAYSSDLEELFSHYNSKMPKELAADETFWEGIRQQYTVSAGMINLNNGGVSPQPKPVQDAFERYNRFSNEAPSYYMWRILDKGRESLRKKLGDLAGCPADSLAICRNTTEALETVIFGLPLERGDEVVLTRQDYPNMINAWKQREKREGIKLKFIDLQLPLEDDGQIVDKFREAFTGKTRVVQITHVINWTGQVLPAAKIASEARKKGIEVLVDGAHSFAHLTYNIPDLDCDYFGTSLHKWLGAPFGTGLLYVKEDKIEKVWPLFAGEEPGSKDIRKFEHLGTRSFPAEQAIGQAINFHHYIGSERKRERLHYLKNYWTEKVREFPGVKIHTSFKPEYSGAIALFSIDGMEPAEIDKHLYGNYKIHTVAINWENIHGVRVTPNVYTNLRELDTLVKAIKEIT